MKWKVKWWQISLIVCLLIAAFSPLASSSPDGLERVAENKGFLALEQAAPLRLMSDYVFPGIKNEAVATIMAGLVGTLIVFGFVYGIAWLVKSRRERPAG